MTRWQGIIEAYRDRLPVTAKTPIVTLGEGNTPLVDAPRISETVGARVMLKVEGANPTGSFKDRGMTMAISKAVEAGSQAVICASTGNTSASAAAYAATVRAAVAEITVLNEQAAVMEAEVESHFGRHPDAEIVLSQPGLGTVLGARVLAEFGDDPQRYASAKARKNYAGTSPVTRA